MENQTNKLIEQDIKQIIGIEDEHSEPDVDYYEPFCIVCKNGKQDISLFLDYETLLDLATKLKPYLDSYEQQLKAEDEFYIQSIENKI